MGSSHSSDRWKTLEKAGRDGENVYVMINYEGAGTKPGPHGMAEGGEPGVMGDASQWSRRRRTAPRAGAAAACGELHNPTTHTEWTTNSAANGMEDSG